MYTVKGTTTTGSDAGTVTTHESYDVHWHRIVHLSEGDVTHEPRMLATWDHILGLRKLYLGSPEMFWKGAFQGLSIEGEPGMNFADQEQAKKDVEDFQDGLKRAMFWTGAKAKSLAPAVADPTNQVKIQLEAIAIDLDCPMRIFMGSERGELASSTDKSQWGEVVASRRKNVGIPKVLIPVIGRFVSLGALPRPARYSADWQSSEKLSAKEAADISLTRTQSLVTFVRGGGEGAMTLVDWYQNEFGYSLEKAEQTVKNRESEDPILTEPDDESDDAAKSDDDSKNGQ
jgi:hypothetical protein